MYFWVRFPSPRGRWSCICSSAGSSSHRLESLSFFFLSASPNPRCFLSGISSWTPLLWTWSATWRSNIAVSCNERLLWSSTVVNACWPRARMTSSRSWASWYIASSARFCLVSSSSCGSLVIIRTKDSVLPPSPSASSAPNMEPAVSLNPGVGVHIHLTYGSLSAT